MGTGKTLHEPFVSKVLIYSPVAEVNITLGGCGGRPGCEQWLSDITDTRLLERPSGSLRLERVVCGVCLCTSCTPHSRPRPSIIASGCRPCLYVVESGDAPPAENSLDSVFHKQGRDSKSFKLLNVVVAGPNKPHSVYFTGV